MSVVLEQPSAERRFNWRRGPYLLGRLSVPLLILVAWQWTGANGSLPHYLSYPSAICGAVVELSDSGELWLYMRDSIFRLLSGFALGACFGVLVGIAAGLSKPVRGFVDPLVGFVYPVPKIAFLPVVMLLFGIGHASDIAIVALSVWFPVFMATQHAVQQIDRQLLWVAQNAEASRRVMVSQVILPAALPGIFGGLRVALALSFVTLFAAELIGAKTGLSLLITEGEDWVRYDIMLTGVMAYALLGFLADRLLMWVRSRVLRGVLLGSQERQP
jgi:ABC-type nitrate/sulfonate/bicarbonate transport system permease component